MQDKRESWCGPALYSQPLQHAMRVWLTARPNGADRQWKEDPSFPRGYEFREFYVVYMLLYAYVHMLFPLLDTS